MQLTLDYDDAAGIVSASSGDGFPSPFAQGLQYGMENGETDTDNLMASLQELKANRQRREYKQVHSQYAKRGRYIHVHTYASKQALNECGIHTRVGNVYSYNSTQCICMVLIHKAHIHTHTIPCQYITYNYQICSSDMRTSNNQQPKYYMFSCVGLFNLCRRHVMRSFKKYSTPEERVQAAVNEAVDDVFKRARRGARNIVTIQWKPRLPGFSDLVRKIKGVKNKIFRKLNPLSGWARGLNFNRIKRSIGSIGRNIVNKVKRGAGGVVRSITGGISRSARGIIGRVSSGIRSAANGIISKVRGVGGTIARKLGSTLGGAARQIGSKIKNSFMSIGRKIFSKVKRIGGGIINGVKGFGSSILRHVKSVGQRAARSVRSVGTMIVRQVKSAGSKVFAHIRQFGSSIWKGVKSFGAKIWGGIKRAGMKLVNSAKKAWGSASGVGRRILSTMKRFGSKMWNNIKGITKKAWGSVKKAGQAVWKTIKKAGKFLHKFAKSPLGQMILRVAMQAGLTYLGVPPMVSGPLVGTALGIINGQKPKEALMNNIMTALPGGPEGPLAGILKQVVGGGQAPPAYGGEGEQGGPPPNYGANYGGQAGQGGPPGSQGGSPNNQGQGGSPNTNQGQGAPPNYNQGAGSPPSQGGAYPSNAGQGSYGGGGATGAGPPGAAGGGNYAYSNPGGAGAPGQAGKPAYNGYGGGANQGGAYQYSQHQGNSAAGSSSPNYNYYQG